MWLNEGNEGAFNMEEISKRVAVLCWREIGLLWVRISDEVKNMQKSFTTSEGLI